MHVGTIDPTSGKADANMWISLGPQTFASCEDTISTIIHAPSYCISSITLDGVVNEHEKHALASILVNVKVVDVITHDRVYDNNHWVAVEQLDMHKCTGGTLTLPQPITNPNTLDVVVTLVDAK